MVTSTQNVANLNDTLYIRFTVGGLAFAASVAAGLVALLIPNRNRVGDTFVKREEMQESMTGAEDADDAPITPVDDL
jgi:hypothetical protein